MNVRNLLIPLLCLGAVAFACGPRSHSEASLVSVNVVRTSPPATTQSQPQQGRRTTRLRPKFAVEAQGGTIRFALDVTNPTKKNLELDFPNGQTHDFVVLDSIGREVYRWGEGRMFTQAMQNRTIDGGGTLHIAEHASASLPLGSYVAVATLRSTNYPVQERVAFELR
jgi:hypothetical protein